MRATVHVLRAVAVTKQANQVMKAAATETATTRRRAVADLLAAAVVLQGAGPSAMGATETKDAAVGVTEIEVARQTATAIETEVLACPGSITLVVTKRFQELLPLASGKVR